MKAQLIDIAHPDSHQTMAEIMAGGGLVGAIWGHHLYFLACNACDVAAVKRLNKLKGRPEDQVFVSPGAVEEVEEFADINKSQGLLYAAKKMRMKPLGYLEFLFKRFPLGVELFANSKAPLAITFATENGQTIWIAGYMSDINYSKFLESVRNLRRSGQEVVFAGTSLNLKGDNTLTVKDFDKVVEYFVDKIEAISVYPRAGHLKRLRFNTSCSVVSFTGKKPRLLRIGCTKLPTLRKYIPDLQVKSSVPSTRR